MTQKIETEQHFIVLRCIAVGDSGDFIPGTYLGKSGSWNKPFSKAMLLTDRKKIATFREWYGDIFEELEVIVREP